MSEREDFERAMARRRRAVEVIATGAKVCIVVAIVIALLVGVLSNASTVIDCENRACPPGQRTAIVQTPGLWQCLCVFK